MHVPGRRRVRLDDDAAAERFRELYDTEFRALARYALRRVARPEDAGDIVADTFLVAWRRIEDVPAGDAARLWLFGVARRIVANHHRGSARGRALGERLRQELERSGGALPVDERAATLRDALARLNAEDRELLLLVSWEGLRPAEVARVMRLPGPTVRTRLHRARRRLRTELERDDADPAVQRVEPTVLMPIPEDAR